MGNERALNLQDSDILYERYVRPLEPVHRGQYVGVARDGRTVLGHTLVDVVRQAATVFDKGNSVVFKVGDKAVGRVR